MAASQARRIKRQQERDMAKMIQKIHRETMQKFKGMSNEQIMAELEKYNASNNITNQETIPGLETLNG